MRLWFALKWQGKLQRIDSLNIATNITSGLLWFNKFTEIHHIWGDIVVLPHPSFIREKNNWHSPEQPQLITTPTNHFHKFINTWPWNSSQEHFFSTSGLARGFWESQWRNDHTGFEPCTWELSFHHKTWRHYSISSAITFCKNAKALKRNDPLFFYYKFGIPNTDYFLHKMGLINTQR